MREELLTVAEATAYERTSLSAEVITFVDTLGQWTDRMRIESLGLSGEGRDIPALVLSEDRSFTPEAAHAVADAEGRPVVMILCNIHAGEVEGKEAAQMLARDVTLGGLGRLMRGATVVLVPNYNPDGNDRIDPSNRKLDHATSHGQIGPESGVGTRYTGEGFNLNRDYTKMDAVETRLLSRFFGRWNPHVVVDSHTSNGSPHAYALTYDTAHTLHSGPREPILFMRDELLPAIGASLLERTGLRTFFYGNFRDNDDPNSGWHSYAPMPRYGSHYRGLTGRLDILLEAYSYSPFADRVKVTYEIFVEILDHVARRGREIVDLCRRAAQDTVARGRDPMPDDRVGIHYGVASRAEGGELVYHYPAHPLFDTEIAAWDLDSMRAWRLTGGELTLWKNTFYCNYLPEVTVRRPRGYVVPADQTKVVDHLRAHNIVVLPLGGDAGPRTVERYRVLSRETTHSPDVGYEPRRETVLFVTRENATVTLRPDDVWVPMDQPLANVAIYLLEPESDDGLVRWGWFERLRAGEAYPILRDPGTRAGRALG